MGRDGREKVKLKRRISLSQKAYLRFKSRDPRRQTKMRVLHKIIV